MMRFSGLLLLVALATPAAGDVFFCPRDAEGITIDGKLDESAWQTAPVVYLAHRYSLSPLFPTAARMTWNDRALYIAFHCDDLDLQSQFTERDSDVWTDGDCIEVFLNPAEKPFRKIELQINPKGALLDIGYKYDGEGPAVERQWNWPGIKWAVIYDGTLNDRQQDRGYTVEMELPWVEGNASLARPAIGATWTMLLTRVNRVSLDDRRNGRELTTWPPLDKNPSFHYDAGYGKLVFVDRDTPDMPVNGYLEPVDGVTGTHDALTGDHRGMAPYWSTGRNNLEATLAWRTHPMPRQPGETVTIAFVGKTFGRSGEPTDEQFLLSVNGQPAIHFAPHRNIDGSWREGDVQLTFQHRASNWHPSGLFTLTLPTSMVAPGEPATLSVERIGEDNPSAFTIRQWTDAARHAWYESRMTERKEDAE